MRGNTVKGICFIVLAAAGFSMMAVFVRLAGPLPVMQKVFFRNLVAALVAIIMLRRAKEPFRIGKGNRMSVFLRSFVGMLGVIANFWAIDHLPIADSTMLNKMSPFFAILMSLFILGERPVKRDWLCLLVALSGAALVIKPGLGLTSLPALVGLFGGFCAGTAYTFVRKAGQGGVKGPVIILTFSIFSCVMVLPFMLAGYESMGVRQLVFLLLSGCAAALGQLGITMAYTYAPAKEISVYDYIQVVFAALFGFLLFRELPDLFSVLGYLLIIGTAIYRFLASKKTA
nr:DMT family transporter [uncultured Stomatobaculum sp.]